VSCGTRSPVRGWHVAPRELDTCLPSPTVQVAAAVTLEEDELCWPLIQNAGKIPKIRCRLGQSTAFTPTLDTGLMDCPVLRHAGRHGDTPLGSQDSGPFRDGCVSCPGTDHFSPCLLCPRACCATVQVAAAVTLEEDELCWPLIQNAGKLPKIRCRLGQSTAFTPILDTGLMDCLVLRHAGRHGDTPLGSQDSGPFRDGCVSCPGTDHFSPCLLCPRG
jgi:hypothetical protein